jgi:hypothetical protein
MAFGAAVGRLDPCAALAGVVISTQPKFALTNHALVFLFLASMRPPRPQSEPEAHLQRYEQGDDGTHNAKDDRLNEARRERQADDSANHKRCSQREERRPMHDGSRVIGKRYRSTQLGSESRRTRRVNAALRPLAPAELASPRRVSGEPGKRDHGASQYRSDYSSHKVHPSMMLQGVGVTGRADRFCQASGIGALAGVGAVRRRRPLPKRKDLLGRSQPDRLERRQLHAG